jgi:tetratricopeptide (TPR) repeat protein
MADELTTVLAFPVSSDPPRAETRRSRAGATEQLTDTLGFEALRDLARRATEAGDLAHALELLDHAREVARSSGERDLIDLATCNRSAVAIELGESEGPRTELRAMLGRDTSRANECLAAYQLARSFELDKNFKKALFYARLAGERAMDDRVPVEYRASALNLLGNILLAESREAEAVRAYEAALGQMPLADLVRRASVLGNLGYCRALQGRHAEALSLLYVALRTLKRRGARHYCGPVHIDLCYTHLETGRLDLARRHGELALDLAEDFGDDDAARNALYLLGEIATLAGDSEGAWRRFDELQRRFYAQGPDIRQLLMAVDVRRLVNLRA